MISLSRREWLALCYAGTPCLAANEGTDYPQQVEDVSAAFEAAPGVQVTQITNSALGNQLSYYDIPCYAPTPDRLIYNTIVSAPQGKKAKPNKPGKGAETSTWGVVSSRTDGTNPKLLVRRIPATSSTVRVDMSQDGNLVTYTRLNDAAGTGWDLYGFRTGNGKAVDEFRITHLQTPFGLPNKVKTSPPVWDAKRKKHLCAFSIDEKVHLVFEDGSSPNGPAGTAIAPLTDLTDYPERREEDTSFHRIRLNPAFPNLLYYRRNGIRDNWVIDLSEARPKSRRITDWTASIHATWSTDGQTLAGSMHGPWVEWSVADRSGRLRDNIKQQEVGPFGKEGRPGIFYGCYDGDSRRIAIATRFDEEPGGSLWVMDRVTGKAVYLCKARYFGPVTAGQPRMGFVDHDRALVFSSDNSAGRDVSMPPQIFVIRPLPKV